jgi:hypothetical protein
MDSRSYLYGFIALESRELQTRGEVCSKFKKLIKDREQAYEMRFVFHEDPQNSNGEDPVTKE